MIGAMSNYQNDFKEIFETQMMYQCIAGLKILSSHDFEGIQRWRREHYFEWFEFKLIIDFATPLGEFDGNNSFLRLCFSQIIFMQFIKTETDTISTPDFFKRITEYRYQSGASQEIAPHFFALPEKTLQSNNMSRIWMSKSTEFYDVQRQRVESRLDVAFDETMAHFLIEVDEFFTIEIIGEMKAWTDEGDSPSNLYPIKF